MTHNQRRVYHQQERIALSLMTSLDNNRRSMQANVSGGASNFKRFGPIADSYELSWEGKLKSLALDVSVTLDAWLAGNLDGRDPREVLHSLAQRANQELEP